jgi:hypothetical protein
VKTLALGEESLEGISGASYEEITGDATVSLTTSSEGP